MNLIRKEYEKLMFETRKKLEEFQSQIDTLQKENKELSKNVEEQAGWVHIYYKNLILYF